MKRTVALLLVVAMVATMVPMLTFGVAAASDGTLSESELVSDNIKLGKGFNVLSGKQLIKENVATGVIFENPTFLTPRVSGASSRSTPQIALSTPCLETLDSYHHALHKPGILLL